MVYSLIDFRFKYLRFLQFFGKKNQEYSGKIKKIIDRCGQLANKITTE